MQKGLQDGMGDRQNGNYEAPLPSHVKRENAFSLNMDLIV